MEYDYASIYMNGIYIYMNGYINASYSIIYIYIYIPFIPAFQALVQCHQDPFKDRRAGLAPGEVPENEGKTKSMGRPEG